MTDPLVEAEELLEQLPEAVSRRTLGERLRQAVTELRTADNQIQRMTALIKTAELTSYGTLAHQQKILAEMIETAQDVGKALQDAEDAETLRSAVYEYSNILKQCVAILDQSIREHWHSVAGERYQSLIGLGELLCSMNVANNLGTRLSACGQKALTSGRAGSAMDLHSAIFALSEEYNVLQAERAAEIGDDEVGDFINALADQQATLAMVTPKVQSWLEEHAVLERLAITTR